MKLYAAAAALVCAACTVAPPEPRQRMLPPEAAWREELLGSSVAVPRRWWSEFKDPALDALVEQALGSAPSIGAARARVQAAREERRAAAGAKDVQADLAASAALQRTSGNRPGGAFAGGTDPLYAGGIELSWEADLWGRLDRAVQVADEGVAVAVELRRVAADALVAQIALEQAQLRGAQGELAALDGSLFLLRESRDLERARLEGGFSTELDVARIEAEIAGAAALRPTIQGRIEAGCHRLAGLAACDVERVRALVASNPSEAAVPADLALGAPLDALSNRSDIRLARRIVLRETALLGLKEAETKPRLTIGAALGAQSTELVDIVDASSRTFSLGGSLLAPLFTGERLEAARDAQLARAEAAAEDWRGTVLAAFTETEAAIVELRRERERKDALLEQRAVQSRALVLAQDRQKNGLVDYFEVLAAQRALLVVDQELSRNRSALFVRTVALLRSLGGQWRYAPDEDDGTVGD